MQNYMPLNSCARGA